jgi:hypothetical protein
MTKWFILSVLTLFFSTVGFAQYVLKTPDGKTVQLNENGTWKYVETTTNGISSKKIPSSSTERYVTKNKKYVVWFNPNEWLCDTTNTTKGLWWDATFNSQDHAITGYCLESRLALPIDSANFESYIKTQFAGQGTIKSFSGFKDTNNGLTFSCFDIELEWNGLIYQYRGYIHSTTKGSFQFTIGTQKEVFEEDKQKILDLFKGITSYQKA